MLVRHSYNSVTNNKYVPSNVIISYTNKNNQYNAMKNNLQKTTYLNNESQSLGISGKEKSRSHEVLDNQLNIHTNEHPPESNDIDSIPENINQNNSSDTDNSTIPSSDTRKGVDAATTNNNNSIMDVSINLLLSQDKNAKQARKGLRPLLPLKK
ncbi:17220_t:CDS:2 [Racocetra persica]|uniref:17220_t:CDS:1 n=1 Tax=Racocetra persica TaxID=160502 RepID=A0ACA9KNN1_9GLOM|nr:17220_t:CDS:2 [Racocetra persica]